MTTLTTPVILRGLLELRLDVDRLQAPELGLVVTGNPAAIQPSADDEPELALATRHRPLETRPARRGLDQKERRGPTELCTSLDQLKISHASYPPEGWIDRKFSVTPFYTNC